VIPGAYSGPHAGIVVAGLLVFAAVCLGAALTWANRQAARLDASELLGAPQLAGVTVCPPGTSRRLGLIFRGLGLLAGNRRSDAAETPSFGTWGYLAATDRDFALIELQQGLAGMKPDHVVAQFPRSAVLSTELGAASPATPLTIEFTNGDRWALEVPPLSGNRARKLAEIINGAVVDRRSEADVWK
jgi:hypothetical protein